MKISARTLIYLFTSGLFLLLTQSCLKDSCDGVQKFIQFDPIYLTVDEIRKDIQIGSPRELCKPGKLFYYSDYIFVNEFREGVHIIDNRDSENPVNVAFIQIPGNVDVAVKGNVMYADNYIDLLAFDITDPTNPSFKTRTENVFETIGLDEELGHLVYYVETENVVEVECNDPNFGSNKWFEDNRVFLPNAASMDNSGGFDIDSNTSGAPSGGIAGSFASFSVINDWLYIIDEWRLDVFDLADPCNPVFTNAVDVEWNIETLFPYGDDLLFMGSQNGMFIFSLENPSNPNMVGEFRHARACDPVVVKDDIAYVTLRSGTFCDGFTNQLDVIDVSNVFNPTLLASFPMENPHGLSVKDNTLYLCEGEGGVKAFDISDINNIGENMLDSDNSNDAYDIIALPHKNVALMIGADGFHQYDITDPSNLKRISHIQANENNCD